MQQTHTTTCLLTFIIFHYLIKHQQIHAISHITRGNCFKLSNQRFYHDVRKYSFIPRIINIWNSLPDFVVNVDSINIFKSRLDKYWINQDIVFDYTADLAGTGDRSEYISSY